MSKFLKLRGQINKLLDQSDKARAKVVNKPKLVMTEAAAMAIRIPQFHAAALMLLHNVLPEIVKSKESSTKVTNLGRWIQGVGAERKQTALVEAIKLLTETGLHAGLAPANMLVPCSAPKNKPAYDAAWKAQFEGVVFPTSDKQGRLKNELVPSARYRVVVSYPRDKKDRNLIMSVFDTVKMRKLASRSHRDEEQ